MANTVSDILQMLLIRSLLLIHVGQKKITKWETPLFIKSLLKSLPISSELRRGNENNCKSWESMGYSSDTILIFSMFNA